MSNKFLRKESLSGIGTVEIRPFRLVDGVKVYDYENFQKNNLIVKAGRATLMDLLVGFRKRKLTYIRWGKGGAPKFPNGDPLSPYDPDDLDEDVQEQLLDKRLSPYNRISPTELEFVETLISDEINDDVNEAGMMFEDEETLERTIFARITFPTIRLTIEKGTGIELQWVFNFNSTKEVIL